MPTRNSARPKPSQLDKQDIQFGTIRACIYRRSDVKNSSWFFRVHVRAEGRFYRKSLGTTDRQEAIHKAQTELISVLSRVQSGERLLAHSLGDVLRKFRLHMAGLVEQGQLSKNTYQNQSSRIQRAVEFLGEVKNDAGKLLYPSPAQTKLTNIDGKVFHGYLDWRLSKKAIRRDVVRDELLIIRKMFHWARKQRFCTDRSIPEWDFHVEKEGAKRERITFQNFRDFVNVMFAWSREVDSWHDRYHRASVVYLASTVAISGMRSGEIFGLKNRDVQKAGDNLRIIIRAETSKVRKERQIIIAGILGKYLEKQQIHKGPDNYVFAPFDDGNKRFRDVFYHLYGSLRERLKEIELDWFDLYHCRHWYITNRLYAGEPIHLVAKVAGTSVHEIESTYSNVLTELTTEGFLKREVKWDPDGSYKVIEKKLETDPK